VWGEREKESPVSEKAVLSQVIKDSYDTLKPSREWNYFFK
jgi:hypothetical protein